MPPADVVAGLLTHTSHYDPRWWAAKDDEEPFDVDVALRLIDAMALRGLNTLLIDCADGFTYTSHPELRRPYSVPIDDLIGLAAYARRQGIDVVPKLNFSKSGRNHHDDWLRPHAGQSAGLHPEDPYWTVAADLIEELIAATRPKAYIHIGMDEDHDRSLDQYVDAILRLRRIVKRHRLRPIVWNDSCHTQRISPAQVHADKCLAAEEHIPRDVVHMLWDYAGAHPRIVRRLVGRGFTVWAAPGRTPRKVENWRTALRHNGGNGIVLTEWIKCSRRNEQRLIERVRVLGPRCRP